MLESILGIVIYHAWTWPVTAFVVDFCPDARCPAMTPPLVRLVICYWDSRLSGEIRLLH